MSMKHEFEKRYYKVPNKPVRAQLGCADSMYFTKRVLYDIPGDVRMYLRIRDEGEKTVVCLKQITDPTTVDGTQELEFCDETKNFNDWVQFFAIIGLQPQSYQETFRELFVRHNCTITIDTWPGLRVVVEIESDAIDNITQAEKLLGLEGYAFAGDIPDIYAYEYNISREDFIAIPELTFNNYVDVLQRV